MSKKDHDYDKPLKTKRPLMDVSRKPSRSAHPSRQKSSSAERSNIPVQLRQGRKKGAEKDRTEEIYQAAPKASSRSRKRAA
jgi:hypothetical protein